MNINNVAAAVSRNSKDNDDEVKYREAFEYFDWNKSGTIPNSVCLPQFNDKGAQDFMLYSKICNIYA